MRKIKTASGITLHYQDRGKKPQPTIVLIMGLGAQMTVWPDELYFGLVENGFRVIRFDNRDVGLSSQFDSYGKPNLLKTWLGRKLPLRHSLPYTLEDMANDVIELMSALKVKKAHLVGASMGGMIAQIIAAKHKKKVLSLTSIMSTSSYPEVSKSNLKVMLKLAKRPSSHNKEAAIRYNVKLNQLIGSPAYPIDEATLHQQATAAVERHYSPAAFQRQLAAIKAAGCRRQLVKKIKAPTLVIHGSRDPIIPLRAGVDTANKIKKAKLKVVDGMGHDFPPILMKKMTKWLTKHIEKAELKKEQRKQKKLSSLTSKIDLK